MRHTRLVVMQIIPSNLFKERDRSLRLNEEAESKLLPVAEQPLKDTIVVMRDTGMRNARELYRMRVENSTSMPEPSLLRNSKTESDRRLIPMSDRVRVVLQTRVAGRTEGLVWQSHYKRKRIGAAMVNRRWVRAREAAGLPANLVNYCARMTTAVSSRQRLAT